MIVIISGSNCSGKTTTLCKMYYCENRKSCLICDDKYKFNYRQVISGNEQDIEFIEEKIYAEKLTISNNGAAGYNLENIPFSDVFLKIVHALLTDVEVIYIDEPENGITDFELDALCGILNVYSKVKYIFITTFSYYIATLANEVINCDGTEEIHYDMLL